MQGAIAWQRATVAQEMHPLNGAGSTRLQQTREQAPDFRTLVKHVQSSPTAKSPTAKSPTERLDKSVKENRCVDLATGEKCKKQANVDVRELMDIDHITPREHRNEQQLPGKQLPNL